MWRAWRAWLITVLFVMLMAGPALVRWRREPRDAREAFTAPADAPPPDFYANISKACEAAGSARRPAGPALPTQSPTPAAFNDDLQLVNPGNEDEAWKRHPIHDSIPQDYLVRYPQTFYYELDNCGYEAALKALFVQDNVGCAYLSMAADAAVWQPTPAPEALEAARPAYQAALAYLSARLAAVAEGSPLYIPDSAPIQVVHDRWLSTRAHATLADTFLLETEVVMYREAKFHGKHVHMTFLARKGPRPADPWEVKVAALSVVGTLFEEHIGMHPTVPKDPLATDYVAFDPNPLKADSPIVMDDDTVRAVMERTKEQQKKQLESTLALSS